MVKQEPKQKRPNLIHKSVIDAKSELNESSGGWTISDGLERADERMDERNGTDEITGLLNKKGLLASAKKKMETLADTDDVLLMYIDLDNFKPVNDKEQNHDRGDRVLAQVAKAMELVIRHEDKKSSEDIPARPDIDVDESLDRKRPGDLLGRIGGDEFVVVMSGVNNMDKDKRKNVSTAMGAVLKSRYDEKVKTMPQEDLSPEVLAVDFSVGSVFTKVREIKKMGIEHFISLADSEMYEVKNGKKKPKKPKVLRFLGKIATRLRK